MKKVIAAFALVVIITMSMALAGGSTALAHKGGHGPDLGPFGLPGCSEWGIGLAVEAQTAEFREFSAQVLAVALIGEADEFVAQFHLGC